MLEELLRSSFPWTSTVNTYRYVFLCTCLTTVFCSFLCIFVLYVRICCHWRNKWIEYIRHVTIAEIVSFIKYAVTQTLFCIMQLWLTTASSGNSTRCYQNCCCTDRVGQRRWFLTEPAVWLTSGCMLTRHAGFMRICDCGIIRIFPKSVHIDIFPHKLSFSPFPYAGFMRICERGIIPHIFAGY